MLVAGSPEGAISSVVCTALDPLSFALPMLVASSPEGAIYSVVCAALDPPSLVDLAVCAADSSVH
eukprot:1468075-Ditylum_brightwellii.AAC.1